jgi:hypothetical protein
MRSKAALRAVLVRVANYLVRQQEHAAAKDLMDYIIKYFPVFS